MAKSKPITWNRGTGFSPERYVQLHFVWANDGEGGFSQGDIGKNSDHTRGHKKTRSQNVRKSTMNVSTQMLYCGLFKQSTEEDVSK